MNLFDSRLPSRFWDRVIPEPNTGCWYYIGGTRGHGYGSFYCSIAEKSVAAHRASWEAANGPVIQGKFLDHLCRVRICVNPSHLEVVTNRENIQRGYDARRPRGCCMKGHPMTPENIYIRPTGEHCCVTCRRMRKAERTAGRSHRMLARIRREEKSGVV